MTTEPVAAEPELPFTAAQLAGALGGIGLALLVTDRYGQVMWADDTFLALVAKDALDVDRGLHLIEVVHPAEHGHVVDLSRRCAAGVTTPELRLSTLMRSDGSPVPVELGASAVGEGDRAVVLFVARRADERRTEETAGGDGDDAELDQRRIDDLVGLDDGETLTVVLEVFRAGSAGAQAKLRSAVAGADADALRAAAHTLRGSASSLGAVGLERLLLDVEQRARAGEVASAATVDRIVAAHSTTCERLQAIVDGLAGA